MDPSLKDRVVLVTGGSKGIGAAIVRKFAQEGATTAFCARQSDELAALETEMRSSGANCFAIPTDVFKADEIEKCVNAVAEKWGRLDLLVNNVGGALRFGAFEDLSDEDWLRTFEFNVLSVVRFTRAALPHLRRSPLRRIINVSSISAVQPGLFNPHYSSSKAAAVNLGKHLANVLAKENILVNTICAGPVHSDSWDQNIKYVAAQNGITEIQARAKMEISEAAKIPLGIVGEGEHIASAVIFLASPGSAWTTGSCFHINGGKLSTAF